MKLIKKEFDSEFVENFYNYTLTATVEVDNKQYIIVIDNNSNYTQDKYCFSTSEYCNDSVPANILQQFEDSDFYQELCRYAKSEAIKNDNKEESDLVDKIEKEFIIYKQDNNYYNNQKLTIYKKKNENDFILQVENIKNNSKSCSYYEISQNDFEEDSNEVVLEEFYEFDARNEINSDFQI